MKIWMHDTQMPSHRIIKLNCEAHSDFSYAGDFSDTELEKFFLSLDSKMNVEKNVGLLKYYGYLHLFIVK